MQHLALHSLLQSAPRPTMAAYPTTTTTARSAPGERRQQQRRRAATSSSSFTAVVGFAVATALLALLSGGISGTAGQGSSSSTSTSTTTYSIQSGFFNGWCSTATVFTTQLNLHVANITASNFPATSACPTSTQTPAAACGLPRFSATVTDAFYGDQVKITNWTGGDRVFNGDKFTVSLADGVRYYGGSLSLEMPCSADVDPRTIRLSFAFSPTVSVMTVASAGLTKVLVDSSSV
ncbi:hypothetical protein DFJ73DRAFT_931986 [Zopfochytrium polystomum]|nr:hypothetical protein DFJ73DRAFT_931986 [Zopfochytrium polystomum]